MNTSFSYTSDQFEKMLQDVFDLCNAGQLEEAEKQSQNLARIGMQALKSAGWKPTLCKQAMLDPGSVSDEERFRLLELMDTAGPQVAKFGKNQDTPENLPFAVGFYGMLNAADAFISTAMGYIIKEQTKTNVGGYVTYDKTDALHGLQLAQYALRSYQTAVVFCVQPLPTYEIRLTYVIGQGCRRAGMYYSALEAHKHCANYDKPKPTGDYANNQQKSRLIIQELESAMAIKGGGERIEDKPEFSHIAEALKHKYLAASFAYKIIESGGTASDTWDFEPESDTTPGTPPASSPAPIAQPPKFIPTTGVEKFLADFREHFQRGNFDLPLPMPNHPDGLTPVEFAEFLSQEYGVEHAGFMSRTIGSIGWGLVAAVLLEKENEDWKEANQALTSCNALDPWRQEIPAAIAVYLYKQGLTELALIRPAIIDKMEKTGQIKLDERSIYVQVIQLLRQGQVDAALKLSVNGLNSSIARVHTEAAAAMSPSRIMAFGNEFDFDNVARPLLQKGKLDAAIEQANQALGNPSHGGAWFTLGVIYTHQKQYDKAENAFQQALLASAGILDALTTLGEIYIRRNEHKRAIPYLKLALEYDPKHFATQQLWNIATGKTPKTQPKPQEKKGWWPW